MSRHNVRKFTSMAFMQMMYRSTFGCDSHCFTLPIASIWTKVSNILENKSGWAGLANWADNDRNCARNLYMARSSTYSVLTAQSVMHCGAVWKSTQQDSGFPRLAMSSTESFIDAFFQSHINIKIVAFKVEPKFVINAALHQASQLTVACRQQVNLSTLSVCHGPVEKTPQQ